MMTKKIFTATFLMFLGSNLWAGKMDQFIKHLGNRSNVTGSGSFQEQQAGHYSGGGMMIRQQHRTLSPINISLPKVGGTCGDFDIRLGSMSFVKSKEIAETFKNIAKGTPIYAVQLALKTTAPQIASSLEYLQSMVQSINSMMLNDCWGRAAVIEALAPNGSAMHQQVCMDMESNHSDYTGAQKRCQDSLKRGESIDKAKKDQEDLLAGEYNLTWNVLNKIDRFKKDNELKNMIMSLVGTVISFKHGEGNYKQIYYDPLADSDQFLFTHLSGGETVHYVCANAQNEKCLKIDLLDHKIDKGLSAEVFDKVITLRSKYLREEVLTEDDKNFLEDAIGVPIYKYIQISAASGLEYPLSRVSEYVALVILIKQFEDFVAEVLQAVAVLESVQNDLTTTSRFKKRLELTRTRLHQRLGKIDGREIYAFEQMIKAKEQELLANTDVYKGH